MHPRRKTRERGWRCCGLPRDWDRPREARTWNLRAFRDPTGVDRCALGHPEGGMGPSLSAEIRAFAKTFPGLDATLSGADLERWATEAEALERRPEWP